MKPAVTVRLKEERPRPERGADLRVRHVSSGLESMGLSVAPLDTQALIELYYTTYNPDIAFHEQLQKIEDLQVET